MIDCIDHIILPKKNSLLKCDAKPSPVVHVLSEFCRLMPPRVTPHDPILPLLFPIGISVKLSFVEYQH